VATNITFNVLAPQSRLGGLQGANAAAAGQLESELKLPGNAAIDGYLEVAGLGRLLGWKEEGGTST
jgi:hypothetical protein